MSERENIAKLSEKLSYRLFSWFKWERNPTTNTNFDCVNKTEHFSGRNATPEHPVDTVFSYFDPYLNKDVYLNIDLKSYAEGSITPADMKSALISLAKTIQCAKGSSIWKKRFVLSGNSNIDIRGMLFIYNHDNKYDQIVTSKFSEVDLDSIPLKRDQYLYLIGPEKIRYFLTLVNDLRILKGDGKLPEDYWFFYPNLDLTRAHGDPKKRAATIELLMGPFLVIQYDDFESNGETNKPGCLVYFNEEGASEYEFLYLLDYLSRFQLLNGSQQIRVRLLHSDYSEDVMSNFERAKRLYLSAWGEDSFQRQLLEEIEIDVVEDVIATLKAGVLPWKV